MRCVGRCGRWVLAAVVAAPVVLGAARAWGQEGEDEPTGAPEQAVESYLERLGLKRLLADLLEKRLAQTPRDLRVQTADRLSRLYVDLLGSATTTQDRQTWEEKARALLAQVPEADSFDLRLSLAKVVYVRAEEIAERQRLRIAASDEAAEADKTFRGLVTQFNDIAAKANHRVESLERIEQTGEMTEKAQQDLSDARRQRSLAFYFAGWSDYYLSMLTRAEQPAADAMRCFGWLLNSSGGRAATPDRVQPGMFQYEHVARAAIGCGMAASLRGNDVEAIRWLEAVEQSDQTPEGVREQLPARKMAVFGQAKRWADLELLVRRLRKSDRHGGGPDVTPLATPLARLLAVITLEADKRNAGAQIEGLARVALGDLVARKEVGQVLDLVSKYGTAPIGETGFIVHYVRALQAYDVARKAHEADSAGPDEPATLPAAINQYRAAAEMFDAAEHQEDADQFGPERARASMMHGRALFYAGDLAPAADAFVRAFNQAGRVGGEEPLWLAVLALERAGKEPGAPEKVRTRLNETIALFLQNYPESERAPRLTLMRVSMGALGDDEALRVLMAVPKESPVYEASRRQVARILYTRYRAARGPEKDFAATRFVAVGEEVLAADRRAAMEAKGEDARQATERVIVRGRQLLDALLSVSSPDVARAEQVMKIVGGVAMFGGYDLKPHMPELTFRELQIAVARNDADQIESASSRLAQLDEPGSQFKDAGERLVYRQLAAAYQPAASAGGAGSAGDEASLNRAAALVKHGVRVIDRLGTDSKQMHDAGVLKVYSTVASAAWDVYQARHDEAMRDLTIKLDRAILGVQPRTEVSLRRLAEASEATRDFKTAASCWRTILEAVQPPSEPWFEAKYQMMRTLAQVDVERARAALREHRILYPDGGPAPWGPKIVGLQQQIGEPAGASPAGGPPVAPAKPADGSGGGGESGGGN